MNKAPVGKDHLELITSALLKSTGAAGVYARSGLFEQVIESLADLISRYRGLRLRSYAFRR